jgi:hypothetical protein
VGPGDASGPRRHGSQSRCCNPELAHTVCSEGPRSASAERDLPLGTPATTRHYVHWRPDLFVFAGAVSRSLARASRQPRPLSRSASRCPGLFARRSCHGQWAPRRTGEQGEQCATLLRQPAFPLSLPPLSTAVGQSSFPTRGSEWLRAAGKGPTRSSRPIARQPCRRPGGRPPSTRI